MKSKTKQSSPLKTSPNKKTKLKHNIYYIQEIKTKQKHLKEENRKTWTKRLKEVPRFKTCFENAFWAKHVLKTKRWIFEAKQRFGRTLPRTKPRRSSGENCRAMQEAAHPWSSLLVCLTSMAAFLTFLASMGIVSGLLGPLCG